MTVMVADTPGVHLPCRAPGANPDDWYEENLDEVLPTKGRGALRIRRENARALCAGCPVQNLCLTGALARGERFGIWGGLIIDDVRRLARRQGYRR